MPKITSRVLGLYQRKSTLAHRFAHLFLCIDNVLEDLTESAESSVRD